MRCKTCDYRLWNIAARQCPECGSPFKPSDFEFTAHSVRFTCPHCAQDYYGDGLFGHLNPIEFDCVRCARHIHMDEMLLAPTRDVPEERTQVDVNPWLERRRIGRVKAWFATIGRGMVGPHRLMRVTPMHAPVGDAWLFAVTCNLLFAFIGWGPFMLFPLMALVGARGPALAGAMGGVAVIALIPTVGVLLFMLLWGLSAHAVIALTGKHEGGLGRTYEAVCYSSGANVFSAPPCLGVYFGWIGWIWWTVSAAIMLREGHRITGARAACAAIALPAVLAIAMIAGMVFMFYAASTAMKQVNAATTAAATSAQLGRQIRLYVDDPSHPPLQHAAQLLRKDPRVSINAFHLVDHESRSRTVESSIRVGDTSMARFLVASDKEQAQHVQKAIQSLPPRVVAHRLGDVVFTWHGIDWSMKYTGLWVAVHSLDYAANPGGTKLSVQVILVDGTHKTFPASAFPAELVKQNRLRLAFNLPPLPDPVTVTHNQPAVAIAENP